MASLTRAALKGLWVAGYKPLQVDYANFFDSFFNLLDDSLSGFKTISKNNTFTSAIIFDVDEKYFNQYTQLGVLTISLDSNTNGAASYIYVPIITDGSDIDFPANWREINNEYANDNALYGLVVFYDGSDYQYWIYKIRIIDTAPPMLNTAIIEAVSDNQIDLGFSEKVIISTLGWTINTDGAALSIISVTGSSTINPVFQLSRSVLVGEVITLDYSSITGDTEDFYENELATFTGHSVTNNVSSFTIQEITVIDNVGLTVTAGTGLQKLAEVVGWDSGCASDEEINSGEGWVEFVLKVVDQPSYQVIIGLSHVNLDANYDTVEFGWFFSSGLLRRIESGSNGPVTGSYADGDKFRVKHDSATITYEKWNGATWDILYTSLLTPTLPLMVDCSFNVDGSDNVNHASLEDVKLAGDDIQ